MAIKKTDAPRKNAARKRPKQPAGEPSTEPEVQPPEPSAAPKGPFVVGIGASAGGLEALEAFFDAMPSDSGVAFIVVTHQQPQQPSMLPDLLGRHTRMPVNPARDREVVLANHVYVCPPGKDLAVLGGATQLMEQTSAAHRQLPIDYFFRSLAADVEDRAICIVLSGTGTDGTLGLRAIKSHAGLAIVQDEDSAHYAGMPHSAAATLLADHVLPPDQMPGKLLAYVDAARGLRSSERASATEVGHALPKIFVLLRDHLGHDFSGYKPNTMERRVERRMRVHGLTEPTAYVALLQKQPAELDLLFHELLINVTQFFRDPSAYEAIGKELTTLVQSQPDQAALRIWVPGCATGEEAYSLAIVAQEIAERAGKHLQLQLFATDLDPQAIEVARLGWYSEGIVADVGAERLQRFFIADKNGFRVQKSIRDSVVFATQNILRDPPFTRLDLLSCRNLLIYLSPSLQQRLFPVLHYALMPGGMLWLGTSETVTASTRLFSVVDRKWKIYRRHPASDGRLPVFDLLPRGSAAAGLTGLVSAPRRRSTLPPSAGDLGFQVEEALVARFAPPTVIVNERGDVAYIHGRTGKFLEPSTGEPRHNLFSMAREGLRPILQSALRSATLEGREVVHRAVPVKTNGAVEPVTVLVRRIAEPEPLRGLYRVSFAISSASTAPGRRRPAKKGAASATQDRAELERARESLHGTLEELQTSNEELTASNEELQSTNEELQSTNEELETSKEELHSLNEELQTVNAELQQKVDELAQVNDDMHNLLNSTDIATLFLDRDLKIKRFTEQARRVVRLISSDLGRPIADLVTHVRYETLVADAVHVLETLRPQETEIQALDGRWLLARILPYRTAQNLIDGVVITFVDIDRLKRAEQLAASRAIADSIVQTVRDPLLVLDAGLCVVSANRAACLLLELESEMIHGRPLLELSAGMLNAQGLRAALENLVAEGQPIEAFKLTKRSSHGGTHDMKVSARRLENNGARTGLILLVLSPSPPERSA